MKGTKDAKKAVFEDLKDTKILGVVEAEASKMRELRWERGMQEALSILQRDRVMLRACRKGEPSKVDLARYLREAYLTPYRWIAENFQMGAPSYDKVWSVGSGVERYQKNEENMENWTDSHISSPTPSL